MTTKETARILAVLQEIWDDMVVSESTVMAWHMAFSDLAYADVMGAVQVYMREGKFRPKPSDLRALVAEAAVQTPDWEDAWAEVMRAVKTWGSYIGHAVHPAGPFPGWSTPHLTAALAHLGGYEMVCSSERDRLPTVRAQFRDYYRSVRDGELRAVKVGNALPTDDGMRRIGVGS